jgi:transaldolase
VKNPDYADTLYISELIAPGTVNTMPEKTLQAFADHGDAGRALDTDLDEAERVLAGAARAGVDLAAVTAELEREGVESFRDSYEQLLSCIESRLAGLPA